MIYLLDTNVVADLVVGVADVTDTFYTRLAQGHEISLCRPVYYEVRRGFLWKKSPRKLATFNNDIVPHLAWQPLTDDDWEQAAQFWAETTRRGRQLSTVDLLIAAIAHRLKAVVVSSDADFDALSVPRQDWRVP